MKSPRCFLSVAVNRIVVRLSPLAVPSKSSDLAEAVPGNSKITAAASPRTACLLIANSLSMPNSL